MAIAEPRTDCGEIIEYMDNANGAHDDALTWRRRSSGDSDEMKTLSNQTNSDFNLFYSEYFGAQKEFMETANKFLEKSKLPPMDLTQADAWDRVQARMEQACLAIEKVSSGENDLSGIRGKMIRAFRGLCRNAATGKLFTALIPDDMGGSILCGGLNVIWSALEQTSMHREAVYKALERLPRILNSHVEFLDLVGQDPEIHRRAAKLYTEVLLTLNHILRWYTTHAFVVGAKRLINPTALSANLNNHVTEVNLAAKDLKARAVPILWRQTKNKIQEISSAQERMDVKIGRQFDCVNYNIQQSQNLSYGVIEKTIFDSVQSLLEGSMQTLSLKSGSKSLPIMNAPELSSTEFLKELDYDADLMTDDIAELARLQRTTSTLEFDISRIRAIHESRLLLAWSTVAEDSLLLVNGHSEDSSNLSTTFVCATIISALIEQAKRLDTGTEIIPLGFLCTQHQNPRHDVEAEPARLAMNLVLQLVAHYPRYKPAKLHRHLEKMDREDISSICKIFGLLVQQLPKTAVVYLILDGLCFRQRRQESDVRQIVDCLVDIHQGEHKATLKFMFSSPTQARFIEDLFEDSEVPNLPLVPTPSAGPFSLPQPTTRSRGHT